MIVRNNLKRINIAKKRKKEDYAGEIATSVLFL